MEEGKGQLLNKPLKRKKKLIELTSFECTHPSKVTELCYFNAICFRTFSMIRLYIFQTRNKIAVRALSWATDRSRVFGIQQNLHSRCAPPQHVSGVPFTDPTATYDNNANNDDKNNELTSESFIPVTAV